MVASQEGKGELILFSTYVQIIINNNNKYIIKIDKILDKPKFDSSLLSLLSL